MLTACVITVGVSINILTLIKPTASILKINGDEPRVDFHFIHFYAVLLLLYTCYFRLIHNRNSRIKRFFFLKLNVAVRIFLNFFAMSR